MRKIRSRREFAIVVANNSFCRIAVVIGVMATLLISSTLSNAQILNAEKFYQRVDSNNFIKGNWDLGYTVISQTTTLQKFQSTLNLTAQIGQNDLTMAGSTFILRSDGVGLVDRSFGHIRFRIHPHRFMTPEIFTQLQFDGIRGMERRLLAGGNLRFTLDETEKGAANFGIGLMNEREGWNNSGSAIPEIREIDTLITTNVLKYNCYIGAYRDITKNVTLGITTYVQAKFTDPFKPRIAGIANVDFKITERLRYSTSVDWFYDSAPIAPIQNLYFTYNQKLVINIRPKSKKHGAHGEDGHADHGTHEHDAHGDHGTHDAHDAHSSDHDGHDEHHSGEGDHHDSENEHEDDLGIKHNVYEDDPHKDQILNNGNNDDDSDTSGKIRYDESNTTREQERKEKIVSPQPVSNPTMNPVRVRSPR